MGDLLDPPAGAAEGEHIADARLVDHLLVELPDAACLLAHEEDAEQPAVGNGAAARYCESLRAGASGESAGDPVPDDAWPQLGELVARITTGQHVEDGMQGALGHRRERRRTPDQRGDVVDGPWLHRHHRDDLLRQHVERVARESKRLDAAFLHALGDHGSGHEVAAMLGEHDAFADSADLVTGAADPLQSARDARR